MTVPPLRNPSRNRTVVTKRITVPGNLRLAVDQFNAGLFFECHETLEEVWQEEAGEVRDLYKGLIQVAAAFVHVTRQNFTGANQLFGSALRYLAPYRPGPVMGFSLEEFCRAIATSWQTLRELGRERIGEFGLAGVPVLHWDGSDLAAEAVRLQAWGFDSTGKPLSMNIAVVA